MNSLKALISDGDGAPSTMRVAVLLILLAMIIPKVWVAISTNNPETFTADDLKMIGVVLGAKAAQSYAESKTSTPPKP
jgi:hypothetical protein